MLSHSRDGKVEKNEKVKDDYDAWISNSYGDVNVDSVWEKRWRSK